MAAVGRCGHPDIAAPPPQPSPWDSADIFRLYGESYRPAQPISAAQAQGMAALVAWRTAHLGGHAEPCPQCGFERYAYNACRNRPCPKGQTITKANGVAARRADLLPTPYCHPGFPLPHALTPRILGNKRLLLGLLFRPASATRLQFGRQNLGGQLGATMVLHTWEQRLPAHFHLHALVPGGALAEDETHWRPTHPQFRFPVKAWGQVFRGKFLEACQPPALTQALCCNAPTAPLRTKAGCAQWLDPL